MPLLDTAFTRSSVSGQFVVIGVEPVLVVQPPAFAVTNAELVRLEPALLAVSAERIKQPLWRQLGVDLHGAVARPDFSRAASRAIAR